MIIANFDNFDAAKNEAQKYMAGGKKHPGLSGVHYSVHHYYDCYIVVRSRDSVASKYGIPIYVARV